MHMYLACGKPDPAYINRAYGFNGKGANRKLTGFGQTKQNCFSLAYNYSVFFKHDGCVGIRSTVESRAEKLNFSKNNR